MGRSWNPLSPQSLNPEVIMETYKLTVNGQPREVTVDPGTPLLWVLREELKMTGTKYGCGIAACGACTVHLGGVATRSCVVPVSLVGSRPVLTIEAMAEDPVGRAVRSEEHTSELQSLAYLVCRLLLEKKKKRIQHNKRAIRVHIT